MERKTAVIYNIFVYDTALFLCCHYLLTLISLYSKTSNAKLLICVRRNENVNKHLLQIFPSL